MSHPLDDCRAKLDRADHHLVDLENRFQSFLDENIGPDPVGDYDEETGEYVAKVPFALSGPSRSFLASSSAKASASSDRSYR